MINNADPTHTPKRGSKRSSAEYMRAMASPTTAHDNDLGSPETPSPPPNGRRSSTSLSFLASPLHPRAESSLSKIGGHDNAFVIPQSPGVKSRLLPPTTPKSKNAEIFLSPSPKLKSPNVQKDNGKPIREISNGLKARLNYAFVKLQNGWVDKTLPELETELKNGPHPGNEAYDTREEDVMKNGRTVSASTLIKGSSYSNEFLNNDNDLPLRQGFRTAEDDDNSNSAHIAFLKALSSPKKKLKQEPPASPLQWSRQKKSPDRGKKGKNGQPSEVEAIETLMSLSSPQRPRSNQEFTLPAPPKRPDSSGPVISPESSSLSAEEDSQTKKTKKRQTIDSQTITVPIMQKQSSESSAESLQQSLHPETAIPLQYDQQQTDIETDIEVSETEQHA